MSKKKIIILVIVVIVAVGGYFLYKKYYHPKEDTRSVYEALVQMTDQKSGNAEEDKRASLKKGDVIAAFPEGHPWTETERNSYLIVKIRLTSEDAAKLTEAVTREKKSGDSGAPEMETIQARKYTLDVDIPTVNELMEKGQPYKDKVFEKGIIDKR